MRRKTKDIPPVGIKLDMLQKIALAKACEVQAKGLGAELKPDLYAIDFTTTLRIRGTLKKEADTEGRDPIPYKNALPIALRLAGVDRVRAKEIMTKALLQAVAMNAPDDDTANRLGD